MTKDSSLRTAAAIGVSAGCAAMIQDPVTALVIAGAILVIPFCWWLMSGARHWIAGFLGAALLLPPLPIALGNSGPHPALVLAAAGVGIGVIRAREWSLRPQPLGRSLLILLSILLASVISAATYSGVQIATGSLLRVLLLGISMYVYFFTLHGPGADERMKPLRAVRWLFAAAVLAAAFACFDFYFQLPAPAGYGPQFVWMDSGVFRRAQGLFYEASTLGNFCAFFLVMIAVAAMQPRESRIFPPWVLAVAGSVFSAALIFSYSRGSLVGLAAALATLLYLRRGHASLRLWLRILPVSLLIGAAAVYFLFPTFGQHYLVRLAGSAEFFFSDPNNTLSGRLDNWRSAITLLTENPLYLLFGVGYKTLPYSEVAGHPLVVDNMYLSLLAETGIAGLLAFLMVNFRILQAAYRAAIEPSGTAAFLGTWIFCFWVGEVLQMLSGDLFTYWRVLPLYFWVLACAERSSR